MSTDLLSNKKIFINKICWVANLVILIAEGVTMREALYCYRSALVFKHGYKLNFAWKAI
jgi:hypothetical protein